MKKKLKPILFMLCIIVSVTMAYTIFTYAGSNKTTYIAFGDSIAAGYGLDGYSDSQESAPAGSYQAITANFLKTDPLNYAVSGDDSTDCLSLLNSSKADDALSEADIITISIGSNDLLKPFIEILKETFGITGDTSSIDYSLIEEYYKNAGSPSLTDIFAMVEKLSGELESSQELHEKVQAFYTNFNEIIQLLKEKAPGAEIYVTNIYNPYKDVIILGKTIDSYVKEINKAFETDTEDYTVIDLYTLFNKENLSNVQFNAADLSGINLDPHPSKQGHQKIALAITNAISQRHAPSAAVISQAKSNAKNKISLKLSCPGDKSGYEIKFSKSESGKWNTLATTTKNKTTIKSNKLKSGKTYYIKARCYNSLNGVKYYGGYSKVKKVKIK